MGDASPVRIVAADGDVDGGSYSLPKHFEVYAARDVRDVAVRGQNTAEGQVRNVGEPPPGAHLIEPTIEDGYLLLVGSGAHRADRESVS